ncbi:cellulase [Alteromonas sediminis]|uniref:Endoglucanase n=2 Tax=Alteromonas sediminis TaxID=2259342 RepID=A0A3N5YAY7_9ALTE|nr:cellulase [Alteromonas sediminis]
MVTSLAAYSTGQEVQKNELQTRAETIKVNQIAYLPSFQKIAVVPSTHANAFSIINVDTGASVITKDLYKPNYWEPAHQAVKVADFSEISTPGTYKVTAEGTADSPKFTISSNGFLSLHDSVLKAYYFNRASIELKPEFASDWHRPLGHPDNQVLVHHSAANKQRPEGTVIASQKGWYDAGDYNKYVVNSGISTYTLLQAYQDFDEFYATRHGGIPESNNSTPDILDEVMWNLSWLESMQDPSDGGVYHKLTTKRFSGKVMPHEATAQRYVVQKSTGAALNYAAVMAKASRVYQSFPTFTSMAKRYRQAAIRAFEWALLNPYVIYQQPSDIHTGQYDDDDFTGEFAWAAAELLLLTKEKKYLDKFNQFVASPTVPSWQDTMALSYISILVNGQTVLSTKDYETLKARFLAFTNNIIESHETSAYRTAMLVDDFVWGSNSVAMNKAMVVIQAYRLTGDKRYLNAAVGLIDYVLGKNPTNYSYVTGFGSKSPMDPHHRQSYADSVEKPIPGFLVGGPHAGKQDNCNYTGVQPADTYLDDWCSYATNEVTINWNAPLVYVLAALHNSQ